MELVWSIPELDCFSGHELDNLLNHLHLNGFAGIEPLYTSTPFFKPNELKKILQSNVQRIIGLRTGGIVQKYGVTFSHPDSSIREKAIDHFFTSIQFATEMDAPLLLVGLLQGKLLPSQNYQDARRNIIDCLVKCANEAEKYKLTIGLEAVNRFLIGYHFRAEDVIDVLQEINKPNVRLLLDTFHMNIEEDCMEETLVRSAPWLSHIHFSDSNRLVPGRGSINFVRLVKVLKALDYRGFISIESDDLDWYPAIQGASRLLIPLIA